MSYRCERKICSYCEFKHPPPFRIKPLPKSTPINAFMVANPPPLHYNIRDLDSLGLIFVFANIKGLQGTLMFRNMLSYGKSIHYRCACSSRKCVKASVSDEDEIKDYGSCWPFIITYIHFLNQIRSRYFQ